MELSADLHHQLAMLYEDQEAWDSAWRHYQSAWQLEPQPATAINGAKLLRRQGQFELAKIYLQAALALWPDLPDLWFNWGNFWRQQGDYAQAEAAYLRTLTLQSEHVAARHNLNQVQILLGKPSQAARQGPTIISSVEPLALLQTAVWRQAPAILENSAQGQAWFENALAELENLPNLDLQTDLKSVQTYRLQPPLWTRYYGFPELYARFRRAYGACFELAQPDRTILASQARSTRMGFLVTAGHEGSFLKTFNRFLALLSEQFELYIFSQNPQTFNALPVRSMKLQGELLADADLIRQTQLALLYFWEVGTDYLNYFLGFFRLAPIQVTSLGVPATSGAPQIDYFLSAQAAEIPKAQEYYTESLICLPRLPYGFQKPLYPRATREKLGFDANTPLLLCAQTPVKIHPQMDPVFCELLARLPQARMILFAHPYAPALDQCLKQRLQKNLGKYYEQIIFLPRQSPEIFLQILQVVDVVLDSFPVCGGMTSYDTLATGAPLVTLRGQALCENISSAIYREIGWAEAVCRDLPSYLDLAQTLALDQTLQSDWRKRLSCLQSEIFNPEATIITLQNTLLELIQAKNL